MNKSIWFLHIALWLMRQEWNDIGDEKDKIEKLTLDPMAEEKKDAMKCEFGVWSLEICVAAIYEFKEKY